MDTCTEKLIGIISQDNIETVGHSLFKNFRLAISNVVNETLQDVSCANDLSNIHTLFIVDEHYVSHTHIWKNDQFIAECNTNNIHVIVFNFEKIYNSQFSWNEDHQNSLMRISNLTQFNSDINDVKRLDRTVITKQCLSKDTLLVPIPDKDDKILFVGQLIPEYYPRRCALINELKHVIDLEICSTDRKLSYEEFLTKVARAKYLLNPLGTGDFINLRFYEALALGCIVLQQYTDEMESYYPELNHPSVIKFKTVDELVDKLKQPVEFVQFTMTQEDYFTEINLKSLIHKV